MLYKLLPICKELCWNILEKFLFIIRLVSCESSSEILNLLFLTLSAHSLYHRPRFFYIDGTKNAKASFWSLKEYKVFYTKFHSAQQNKLYALIQVICLHPFPINIVSDSMYSVFVLKNIETSTIETSNQPIIQQLFFELQSVVKNHNSPIYITHIRAHSCLPGPMTFGNEQADKLVSFATPEEQHALLHNNAGSLHQLWKIP